MTEQKLIDKITRIFKDITIERYDEIQHDDRAFGVMIKYNQKDISTIEIAGDINEKEREHLSIIAQREVHSIISWLEKRILKTFNREDAALEDT